MSIQQVATTFQQVATMLKVKFVDREKLNDVEPCITRLRLKVCGQISFFH